MATQGSGEIDAARKRLALAEKWEASAQRQLGEAAQERKRAEADLKAMISVDDDEGEGENSSPPNKRRKTQQQTAPAILLKHPFDGVPSNSSRLAQSVVGLTELAGHSLGVVGIRNSETTLNSTAHALVDSERQIVIRPGDRERLRSGGPLNRILVDFWMRWISRADASANSSVHFFPTGFISKLIDDGPESVQSFAPDMNPFEKKFLFLPVNADLHWSLCVIVNPGLIGNNYDDYLPEDEEHAYILMLQSRMLHNKKMYAKHIRNWLDFEWKRRDKGKVGWSDDPFSSQGKMHVKAPVVPGRPGEASDSGVFVCRYAYSLYLMRRERFTWNDIAEDPPFSTLITNGPAFQFDDGDISRIRIEYGLLIDRLSRERGEAHDGGSSDGGAANQHGDWQEPDVAIRGLDQDDTLQRICRNDSGILGLHVSPKRPSHARYDTNYKRAGDAVGSNTHLKTLVIGGFGFDNAATQYPHTTLCGFHAFCRGATDNTSIEVLALRSARLSASSISALEPFFERNINLRCIEMSRIRLPSSIDPITVALLKCHEYSLRKLVIKLSRGSISHDDREGARFISSLGRHLSLESLELSHFGLGTEGCTALAKLLTRSGSGTRLRELNIAGNPGLDDACISTLIDALETGNTVKELDVGIDNDEYDVPSSITSAGWCGLAAILHSRTCSLETIVLDANAICDQAAVALACALEGNTSVRALSLTECQDITGKGWRAFGKCLQSPISALEELHLDRCNINDDGAIALGEGLASNSSVQYLNIGMATEDMTRPGWASFFRSLLENKTLRFLALDRCPSIGLDEWLLFSNLLRRPGSVLENLTIDCDDDTHDDVAICLADALAHNASLISLDFRSGGFTDMGWAAFSEALCNTSTIESTHSSNHTLESMRKSPTFSNLSWK